MNASCHLVQCLAVLGCAAPSLPAAQEERATPLRFGDPDGGSGDPFFPGATYDESIATPDSFLGQEHGTRLAHHDEILTAFRDWAAASDRITLGTHGQTHEGRELIHAVITSPVNHARLEEIRADLARLHDPRGLSDAEARRIVSSSPASAWMGYSIHGDELSGSDASMAVAYHLIAGMGEEVEYLLDRLVIVIDPCLNPDGRERIVAMVEQSAGKTLNLDYASMHRGHWPYGRGNHYLFDMNRDWMAGTQPETRGRWEVARSFHPQLFVDAHEMDSLDTFLFYPQARPLNPNLPPKLIEWQRRYAEDAGAAFDAYGWSYYSREWADAWAPFYSDSWGSLIGGTGILYEQASTSGFPLRRRSGELLTYREAVHHQAVASLANLTTLANNREQALADYLELKRRNVSTETPGNDRMFVVRPGANRDRIDELLRILSGQGIEVLQAASPFDATNVLSSLGAENGSLAFEAGTLVVKAAQPMSQMVHAYFEFDARMPLADLVKERQSIEQGEGSKIYDLTSWSLPHALDVNAYWCDATDIALERVATREFTPEIVGPEPAIGWIVSAADDAMLAFAARAMEAGVQVNVSDKAFTIASAGQVPAGSLLVRLVENEGDVEALEARLMIAAEEAGLRAVQRVTSGLTPTAAFPESPDLGGQHFTLLSRPRVAILSNAPVAPDTYGHLWHHLDQNVGVPFTFLDAQRFGSHDLRRYNVLVIPPGGGSLSAILEANKSALETWVEGGGTLIACGSSAALLTSGRLELSSVTLRRHALENLTPYRIAAQREWASREVEIDEALVWGDPVDAAAPNDGDDDGAAEAEEEDAYDKELVNKDHDSWLRKFAPQGVTLRGIVDPRSWITRGTGPELPVFFGGSNVFLSRSPAHTAVRLATQDRLRLSGLVWPEARERIAESAWLTVERHGNGQIILFAAMPAFRGYHLATARLFANAVVLGPGLGANQPSAW